MTIELTKDEVNFLSGVLKQLSVNAANPESKLTVEIVQSVLSKLNAEQKNG